jgi:N-carbamoyl-L-amino-acid hydrolase
MQNLQINGRRLWNTLMETAKFGGTAKGGINRLTLTDEDKKVRDWFKAAVEAIGCTVTVDEVGNMFARRAGIIDGLAPVCMGSHLDTQPTGGKFDGVLGVLGALEVMRTIHESGYETNAPVVIVNWTNEEGSRFAPACLPPVSSPAFSHLNLPIHVKTAKARNSVASLIALAIEDLRKQACISSARCSSFISSRAILEDEGKTIGVVTGVQSMRWYEVTVFGQDAHAGATPMYLRKNALLGAARLLTPSTLSPTGLPARGRYRRPHRQSSE